MNGALGKRIGVALDNNVQKEVREVFEQIFSSFDLLFEKEDVVRDLWIQRSLFFLVTSRSQAICLETWEEAQDVPFPVPYGVFLDWVKSFDETSCHFFECYGLSRDVLHTPCGERIRLRKKESQLLGLFMKAGKNALPKDQILKKIWGYGQVIQTQTLETHVSWLRQKLQPFHLTIESDPGSKSYRLQSC